MASTTRAIVSRDTLDNNGWKLEDVTVRAPSEGELLVEMVASGICHTDVLVGGLPAGAAPIAFYPRVLGHEGGGYVKATGAGVTVAQPGDPVLLSYAFCQRCAVCKTGHYSHCAAFNELNFAGPYHVFSPKSSEQQTEISGTFFGQSSFANLSIVKQCSVVNVKDIVKDKSELQLFSPLGCGIQTGSGSIIHAAQATSDDVVVIMGLGSVGLSAVMGAKIQRCREIIGIDRVASRMQLARDLGCTQVLDTSKMDSKDILDAVKKATGGDGPTITVDTSGAPVLIKAGVEFTRNRGKILQVGSPPFDFKLEIDLFGFMVSGKQLIGAVEGQAYPPDYVPKMIQWYREGKFPIDRLIKLMPVAEYQEALKEMHEGSTIKPVICWS